MVSAAASIAKSACIAITPGFLRSEAVLETLHVTEANWRDAIKKRPEFAESERSPRQHREQPTLRSQRRKRTSKQTCENMDCCRCKEPAEN